MATLDEMQAELMATARKNFEIKRQADRQAEAESALAEAESALAEAERKAPHPLLKAAENAVTRMSEIKAKISEWEQDRNWSVEKREEFIAALKQEAQNHATIGHQWAETVRAEFDSLTTDRRNQITAGRLNDHLNNPVAAQGARSRLETLAKNSSNLRGFEIAYERAQTNGDVYLRYAYQVYGPQLVTKFSEPAGGFMAQMERDYENSFLPEDARTTFAEKFTRLRDGSRAAMLTSRKFEREERPGRPVSDLFEPHQPVASNLLQGVLNDIAGTLGDDGFGPSEPMIFGG